MKLIAIIDIRRGMIIAPANGDTPTAKSWQHVNHVQPGNKYATCVHVNGDSCYAISVWARH